MKALKLLVTGLFCLIVFLGVSSFSSAEPFSQTPGTILYVKPGVNGLCANWADSCDLQTALFNATSGDQIWVAAGTHKPTTSSDRTKTFQLKSGVAIYGGFPTAGGTWTQRNWVTNITTLSGDLNGDDGPDFANNADNSYHVVTGNGVDITAVLDGFTISRGNANGVFPDNYGGGMLNDTGNPTLSTIIFSSNTALFGGGLSNIYASNPILTEVTFADNLALERGGGIYNSYSCSPALSGLIFSNNSASQGGGMANNDSSSPLVMKSTFIGNTASVGGGIWNYRNSNPTLTDVNFVSNSASSGGGMSVEESDPTLTRVSFVSNSATYGGGGLYFHYCGDGSVVENVTFSNNTADYRGAGLLNHYSSPMLINVTFSGNASNVEGGGIFNHYNSHPMISNSIIWGNAPDQIFNDESSSMQATYNIVQRGYPGEGNLVSNPLLGALKNNGGFSETHALSTTSPAIDAGNPDLLTCPETDQRALPRPIDGNGDDLSQCDMGAYEIQPYGITTNIVGSGEVHIVPYQPDYALSQQVTLTATANPGWTFSSWSGDVESTDNPLTVTIMGNTSITANFTPIEYILTIAINPPGSGTVTKDLDQGTYHYGDIVELTANPSTGWSFTNWTGDATGTTNPVTITIEGNTTITANFTPIEYTLNVAINPPGAGIVTRELDQLTYHYGDEVELTANPSTGWSFTNWSGGTTGTTNPLTITIEGTTSITANFTQDEYTLTIGINPPGSGTVARDLDQATYHYGDEVTLTANPSTGWSFTNWSVDATGTTNPLTITIEGNTSITANLTQDEYTVDVTISPAEKGTVAINPAQITYHYGDVVTLTPSANLGWTFSGWSVDAGGSDNPLTVTIEGNTSITATFTQDEYTLAVSIAPEQKGTVTIDPEQNTYHYGDTVTLTATGIPGWTFSGWTGDLTSADNPLTLIINVNTNITANFIQDEYTLVITIAPDGKGSVLVDPDQGTYHYGDVVLLTASPTLTGWRFTGWSDGATGSDPLTVTIKGNTSITANFSDQYTLTANVYPAGAGTVTRNLNPDTYTYGTQVALTANPKPGWTFTGWSGDVTSTNNPLTVTIEVDTTITANFTPIEYTLTVEVAPFGTGTVTLNPDQATYHYGDEVILTATPGAEWAFSGWSGDLSSAENPFTIMIIGNTNITANFGQIFRLYLPLVLKN